MVPRSHVTQSITYPSTTCSATVLKEMLKQKLVDSGWREDLKQYTMGALQSPSCRPQPLLSDGARGRSDPDQGRRAADGRAAHTRDHASWAR